MDKLRWYHYLVLGIGVIGVLFGPLIFTRQVPFDWQWLDFTETGQIGDTIGGITAPVVGLVSVLLLWWTLREQLRFNTKQDTINNDQKKFNDASMVLSMQTQIMQLDNSIRYYYTTYDAVVEGRGYSSLSVLKRGTAAKVAIAYDEFLSLIEKIHILEVSVCSLVTLTQKSSLSEEEKQSTCSITRVYLNAIKNFYAMAEQKEIDFLVPLDENGDELIKTADAQKVIIERVSNYRSQLDIVIVKCEKKVANVSI